jgi:16S rRNA A1518/A1519 N6-dimethyltransferase RsmA/KsgA/DIM1 with predicted DNA glycosylase/AP lyase activity
LLHFVIRISSMITIVCRVLKASFQQRRKMLRQSLKTVLAEDGLTLDEAKWGTKRPEELRPHEFIELVIDLYGERSSQESPSLGVTEDTVKVWRLDKR